MWRDVRRVSYTFRARRPHGSRCTRANDCNALPAELAGHRCLLPAELRVRVTRDDRGERSRPLRRWCGERGAGAVVCRLTVTDWRLPGSQLPAGAELG